MRVVVPGLQMPHRICGRVVATLEYVVECTPNRLFKFEYNYLNLRLSSVCQALDRVNQK